MYQVLVLHLLCHQPNLESVMGKAYSDVCHSQVPRNEALPRIFPPRPHHQSCPNSTRVSPNPLSDFDWNQIKSGSFLHSKCVLAGRCSQKSLLPSFFQTLWLLERAVHRVSLGECSVQFHLQRARLSSKHSTCTDYFNPHYYAHFTGGKTEAGVVN